MYILEKTSEISNACRIWGEFSEKVIGKKIAWTQYLATAFWNTLYKFVSSYDIDLTKISGYDRLQRQTDDEFALQYVCKNLLYVSADFPTLEQLSFVVSNSYFQVMKPVVSENSFVLQQGSLQYALSVYASSLSEIEGLACSDFILSDDESNLLSVFSVILKIFLGVDFPLEHENYDTLWEFIETRIAVRFQK
jgi:hypothetical protein